MRDALVSVVEALREVALTLGPGKVFVGAPAVEQTGKAPYTVIDVLSIESEYAGPSCAEWRAEVAIYRVTVPPTGKKGDEAKLSALEPLCDVRSWAGDLLAAGYVVEVRSHDLQYDRESEEREVIAALTLVATWQECV